MSSNFIERIESPEFEETISNSTFTQTMEPVNRIIEIAAGTAALVGIMILVFVIHRQANKLSVIAKAHKHVAGTYVMTEAEKEKFKHYGGHLEDMIKNME